MNQYPSTNCSDEIKKPADFWSLPGSLKTNIKLTDKELRTTKDRFSKDWADIKDYSPEFVKSIKEASFEKPSKKFINPDSFLESLK